MYEWFTFALIWIVIWLLIYLERPQLRRQMLGVSIISAFTGLTEPLFVPRYWTPVTLFNMAETTHFDLESIIFSFGVAGVASVLYETALNAKHRKMDVTERKERRWLHLASLASSPVVFLLLFFFTNLNPIYSLSAAMFAGAVAAVICRPDLLKHTLLGGALFTVLYFVFFGFVNSIFPTFLDSWNMAALSGILVLRVPIEEIMYAFAFGTMWSGIFEHVRHYTLH
jgi:hypothetical protein